MTELVKVDAQPLALRHELSVAEVAQRIKLVHQVVKDAMVEGHHYGRVPGIEKPILMKAGMELLCMMFRLDAQYESTQRMDADGHLTVKSTCTLWHIPTGQRWGSGEGSCSTRESRYAYRKAARVCPQCGKEAIIKGKEEYGGGWLCFKKREGCGAKFKDGDASIEAQPVGRVPNEDLADQYNTVLKMANKRAKGDAVLTVTAASDLLTVDLEDLPAEPPAAVVVDPPLSRLPDGTSVLRLTESETVEEEADRLFKTPAEMERAEKLAVMERIARGFQSLKVPAGEQVAHWERLVGTGAFMDPDGGTLDGMNALLEELRKAAKKK